MPLYVGMVLKGVSFFDFSGVNCIFLCAILCVRFSGQHVQIRKLVVSLC